MRDRQVFVEFYFDLEDDRHPIISIAIPQSKSGRPPTKTRILKAIEKTLDEKGPGWDIV